MAVILSTIRERERSNGRLEEVPGEGHWFDGVMTHGETKDFLRDITSHAPSSQFQNVKFVISNPREMGRRGDVTVEQLLTWQR